MERLARLCYVARNVYLDPNEEDFGIAPSIFTELCYRPDGRRRSIGRGELICQRCVEINRDSQSVHLRERRGRWEVVHHSSNEGPCYAAESDEHKAWKERIATVSERAALAVPGADDRGVMRRWVSPRDRDRYAEMIGHPCTEPTLPEHLRLGVAQRPSRRHGGRREDSVLHTGRRPPSSPAAAAGPLAEPRIPVVTLPPLAPALRHDGTCNTWVQGQRCGDVARFYAAGWRCSQHSPRSPSY